MKNLIVHTIIILLIVNVEAFAIKYAHNSFQVGLGFVSIDQSMISKLKLPQDSYRNIVDGYLELEWGFETGGITMAPRILLGGNRLSDDETEQGYFSWGITILSFTGSKTIINKKIINLELQSGFQLTGVGFDSISAPKITYSSYENSYLGPTLGASMRIPILNLHQSGQKPKRFSQILAQATYYKFFGKNTLGELHAELLFLILPEQKFAIKSRGYLAIGYRRISMHNIFHEDIITLGLEGLIYNH
jgi:hypothetical protein